MWQRESHLPPQTPFSPSPISDRNTRGKMNSMASMTCSKIPHHDPSLASPTSTAETFVARHVARQDMMLRACVVRQDFAWRDHRQPLLCMYRPARSAPLQESHLRIASEQVAPQIPGCYPNNHNQQHEDDLQPYHSHSRQLCPPGLPSAQLMPDPRACSPCASDAHNHVVLTPDAPAASAGPFPSLLHPGVSLLPRAAHCCTDCHGHRLLPASWPASE